MSELGSSPAQSSGRSFMYIKNNKGPNMLLCGIQVECSKKLCMILESPELVLTTMHLSKTLNI